MKDSRLTLFAMILTTVKQSVKDQLFDQQFTANEKEQSAGGRLLFI